MSHRLRLLVCLFLVLLPLPAQGASTGADALLLEAEGLYSGTSGKRDCERAEPLFEQAAETGDPRAVLRKAILHAIGKCGFELNPAKAERLAGLSTARVEQLAADGDGYCQYLIGMTHLLGLGRPDDPYAALEYLIPSAEGGEIWAMYNLGWIYEGKEGIDADWSASLHWYRKAALQRHVTALRVVGEAHLGLRPGARRDPAAGKKLLEQAIEMGDHSALTSLAVAYDFGRGLDRDPRQAVPLYRKASALGDSAAMYHLGQSYFRGDGVPLDYHAAVGWVTAAAEHGFAAAAIQLAGFYDEGLHHGGEQIVEASRPEAVRWYRSAAELGSSAARGWLLYEGLEQ